MTYEVMTGMINLEDLEVESTKVAEVTGGSGPQYSALGGSICGGVPGNPSGSGSTIWVMERW